MLLKYNSYKEVLIGQFRHDDFEKKLFNKVKYIRIDLTVNSLIKHSTAMSLLIAFSFFITNSKENIPRGEIFFASLMYGILKYNKTKIVYSLYDSNRLLFGLLAKNLKNIIFLGQYPAQLITKNTERIIPSNARLFVFGENDKKSLISLGYAKSKIDISGSIFLDLFSKSRFNKPYKKCYDICIISNVSHEWVADNEKEIESLLIENVEKYLTKNKNKQIKIVICGRPQNPKYEEIGISRERIFFKNLIKNYDAEYIKNVPEEFTTYVSMLKSKSVIANSSNVAIEAIGLNIKTMFYQPFPFFVPAPHDYRFTEISKKYDDFEKTLESLFNLSDQTYKKIIKDFKTKYIDNSNRINLVKYRIDNIK